ncbi:hypothetical protein LTR49_026498, partial [Elasticomyces elasticus]
DGAVVIAGALDDVEDVGVVDVEETQVPPTRMEDTPQSIGETTGKIVSTGARMDVTPRSPPPVEVGPVEVEGTQVPPTRMEDTPQRIGETTGKIVSTGARMDVRPRSPPCGRASA